MHAIQTTQRTTAHPVASAPARPSVAGARRVVIKLGTRVLTDEHGGLATERVASLVASAAALRATGRQVVVVSSGAIGLGSRALSRESPPRRASVRQACAAVGQATLTSLYLSQFRRFDLVCGQVLIGQADFHDRLRFLELRDALEVMLARGVVPIVNENDAVGDERCSGVHGEAQPVFDDNDRLAALVATEIDADLLVLMTDVAGVYDCDPRHHSEARLLSRIDDPTAIEADERPGSAAGRGGMRSKVTAAWIAASSGCQAVIADGRRSGGLSHLLAGDEIGSWFPASGHLDARHRWIAFATLPRGALCLDEGAIEALEQRGASLLPVGVTEVIGEFGGGDVVELTSAEGRVVGRAVSRLSAPEVRDCLSGEPDRATSPGALIRRSEIVLAGKPILGGVS